MGVEQPGASLASHAASLQEFRAAWTQSAPRRAARETREAKRTERRRARQSQRRAYFEAATRAQYRQTAGRLRRLGFAVDLPPDFFEDTLAPTEASPASGFSPALATAEAAALARDSRFGYGLKRRDLSLNQRRNRLRLQLVWFLAVVGIFVGFRSLPAFAQEQPAASITVTQSGARVPDSVQLPVLSTEQTGVLTQTTPNPNATTIGPTPPTNPANPTSPGIRLDVNGFDKSPSTAVLVFLLITVLSIAPSLLLMMTSFTKIFIVLAMARNALGLNQIPPTQVISGLAVFLTLFIMAPTVTEVWDKAIVPYMNGRVQIQDALKLAEPPVRNFMGPRTREEDIALMTRAANRPNPASLAQTPFTTLVPAFMISEVRSAFIIGFVVFIPFLVIDLVVGAALMSMGMMMLPPVMVSLPFKVLLFVMVDGWGMLTQTLIGTYR